MSVDCDGERRLLYSTYYAWANDSETPLSKRVCLVTNEAMRNNRLGLGYRKDMPWFAVDSVLIKISACEESRGGFLLKDAPQLCGPCRSHDPVSA